jgi:hypothetical protein
MKLFIGSANARSTIFMCVCAIIRIYLASLREIAELAVEGILILVHCLRVRNRKRVLSGIDSGGGGPNGKFSAGQRV